MSDQKDDWVSLSDAYAWVIQQNMWLSVGDQDVRILTKAIRGSVRVRGVPAGSGCWLRESIVGAHVPDLDLRAIRDDELKTSDGRFGLVEINQHELKTFVRTEWPDYFPDDRRPGDGTVHGAFARSIAYHLQEGTQPTRREHLDELRQELPGLTEEQYDDVKKAAIDRGDLPAAWAKGGRRKSR